MSDLGDGGGDPDAPQGLLQNRQGLAVIAHPHLDQALGGKAEPRQTRRIEIGPAHGPHHRPPVRQTRGQAGHEGAGRRAGFTLQPLPRRLMPSAERQSRPAQEPIDPRVAEGERAPCVLKPPIQGREGRAQGADLDGR